MHILYGIQGTGNGHISRASAMLRAFRDYPQLQVTWLLSGRDPARGCGLIEDFQWREGVTFVTANGKVLPFATLKKNNLFRFLKDIRELELDDYDLVITDFEPVIAHAARRRGIPVTGIGHQYAFDYKIPMQGTNPVVNSIMKHFAPVTTGIGLHWHHFDAPILPPIIDLELPQQLPPVQPDKIIAYLPFENLDEIVRTLRGLDAWQFHIYHPDASHADEGHLHIRPISRDGFKQDLLECSGTISNAGFELISECLHLGKRVMAMPLKGQMEQLSNAAALQQLGYATIIRGLDPVAIGAWLEGDARAVRIHYPDVAAALARWIADGQQETARQLADMLWRDTVVESVPESLTSAA